MTLDEQIKFTEKLLRYSIMMDIEEDIQYYCAILETLKKANEND